MTLVERLRAAQLRGNTVPADMHLLEEAADRIAELEAKLREVGELSKKWIRKLPVSNKDVADELNAILQKNEEASNE